jgi:hypothetical protein
VLVVRAVAVGKLGALPAAAEDPLKIAAESFRVTEVTIVEGCHRVCRNFLASLSITKKNYFKLSSRQTRTGKEAADRRLIFETCKKEKLFQTTPTQTMQNLITQKTNIALHTFYRVMVKFYI